jgi:hypothetical protein
MIINNNEDDDYCWWNRIPSELKYKGESKVDGILPFIFRFYF